MDPHDFIAKIDAYCSETGLQPSTVCSRAVGNPRLYDRIKARLVKLGEEDQLLSAWIEQNPPKRPPTLTILQPEDPAHDDA